jgi:rare lipoprotein A
MASTLKEQLAIEHVISHENGLYKLRLGPMQSDDHAQTMLNRLRKGEFTQAFLLYSEQQL